MGGKIMALHHILFIGVWILKLMPQVTSNEAKFPLLDGCFGSVDEETCRILNVYCRNLIRLPGISYRCSDTGNPYSYSNYNSYSYSHFTVHLHFKQDSNDQPLNIINNGYDQYIHILDVSNNELEQVLSIPEMQNLKTLNFSNNCLTKAKLSNRNRLQSLTTLDYSYNTINTIIVYRHEEIFYSLSTLNLSHNNLTVISDSVFESFSKMTALDLSHNYIDLLNILTFEGLRNLVQLNLSNNRITDINLSLLRFKQLNELDMSHNALTSLKYADFNKLAELRKLDLSFNSIVNVESNVFDYSIIRSINLSKNALKSLPVNLFSGRNLTMFSIKENKLENLSKGVFEGLTFVTELDLGGQKLSTLENYTFSGLESLYTLLLKNNDLTYIPSLCFDSLYSLELLDLSGNHITKVEFSFKDLLALKTLFLNNNNIDEFSPESFQPLNVAQLNISHNNLSDLSQKGFKNLNNLTSFSVRHNPIAGDLKENSFSGLHVLPTLDISGTLLVGLRNGSFRGMEHLMNLNISHGKIVEIDFNTFANTSGIETLDLSFNQLSQFLVNTIDLANVSSIFLNNNLLITITPSYFKNMVRLSEIKLSYNKLVTIDNDAFVGQLYLLLFDISNNPSLEFNATQIKDARSLDILIISGIKSSKLSFENFNETSVTILKSSNCGVRNVSALQLRRLGQLQELKLSHNLVARLDAGAFTALTDLRTLDLSHNHIAFIQPGVFKDNSALDTLNISHNLLANIPYGVFNGLKYISTIDFSYNHVTDLESEKFYQLKTLSVIIADYNQIKTLRTSYLNHTSLHELSIGGNPIPCIEFLQFEKFHDGPLRLTAIKKDESSENVNGISCNPNGEFNVITTTASPDRVNIDLNKNQNILKILINIRDILENSTTVNSAVNDIAQTQSKDNFTSSIEKSQQVITNLLINTSSLFINGSNQSNSLLEKLLASGSGQTNSLLEKIHADENKHMEKIFEMLMKRKNVEQLPYTPKPNATLENLIAFVNDMKRELHQTVANNKDMITDLNNEVAYLHNKLNESNRKQYPTNYQQHNDPSSFQNALVKEKDDPKSFVFLEVCLSLILFILVAFILYKLYKSKLHLPTARSYSTRNLPDEMENSNLRKIRR